MTIMRVPDSYPPENVTPQQYPASTGEVFAETISLTWDDNPIFGRGLELVQRQMADGEILNKQQIEDRLKAEGVAIESTPESLKSEALDMLVSRQKKKQRSQAIIDSAEPGFAKTAATLSAGFLASSVDPLIFASNFIPATKLLGMSGVIAGSFASKTAQRAVRGLADGAMGAVATEPFGYALAQAIDDDYQATELLTNTIIGAGLGAGLHTGLGAIGDAFAKMPAAQKAQLLDVAMAQSEQNLQINVQPLIQEQMVKKKRGLNKLREKIQKAEADGDTNYANILREKEAELAADIPDGFDENATVQASTPEHVLLDDDAKAMLKEEAERLAEAGDTSDDLAMARKDMQEAVRDAEELAKIKGEEENLAAAFKEIDGLAAEEKAYFKNLKQFTNCVLRKS